MAKRTTYKQLEKAVANAKYTIGTKGTFKGVGELLDGKRCEIIRQSKRTGGLTVRTIECILGIEYQIMPYNFKPLTENEEESDRPIRLNLTAFLHKIKSCDKFSHKGETSTVSTKTRRGEYVSVIHGLASACYFVGTALDEEGTPFVIELVG